MAEIKLLPAAEDSCVELLAWLAKPAWLLVIAIEAVEIKEVDG